jgi:hypothetical protein
LVYKIGIESLDGKVKLLESIDPPRLQCDDKNLVLGISKDRV